VSADPFLKLHSGLITDHFNSVMHASDADALPGHCVNQFQPSTVFLDKLMTSSPVHVKHNRICALKDRFILRPAVQNEAGFESADPRQAFVDQLNTGVEFMHSRRVRGFAGNQNQFSHGGRRISPGCRNHTRNCGQQQRGKESHE